MRVIRAFPERFVRIGNVDHQTKRFLRFLGLRDAGGGGGAVGLHVFKMRLGAVGQRIEIGVPRVGLVGRRMADLAADAGEVATGFHEIHEVRPAGVFHLIKTLNLVVVRVKAGKHYVAAGHAVAHGGVRVRKAQRLRGEPVHVRRGAGQFAAVHADGIATHVVDRQQQNVRPVGRG